VALGPFHTSGPLTLGVELELHLLSPEGFERSRSMSVLMREQARRWTEDDPLLGW